MALRALAGQAEEFSVEWVSGGHAAVEAHSLLQESLGPANVEGLDSFMETVAPWQGGCVRARMLCASDSAGMLAVVAGARLRRLNAGMLLYSAVREDARGLGHYSMLRSRVLAGLQGKGGKPLNYIVSELEPGGLLWRRYLGEWGAWVVPCDYRVPATQGLSLRPLDLVIAPVATSPGPGEIAGIVREIYEGVYRLVPADASEEFRTVVQSIRNDAGMRGALR